MNCSVLELLQTLTHKLFINTSNKLFKIPPIPLGKPYRNQSIIPNYWPTDHSPHEILSQEGSSLTLLGRI